MLKVLRYDGRFDALAGFGATKPIFGTCAGAILMARDVSRRVQESFGIDGHRGGAQRLRAEGGQPGGCLAHALIPLYDSTISLNPQP